MQDLSSYKDRTSSHPKQIVYIAHNQSVPEAVHLYLQHVEKEKKHSKASLRSIANTVLLKGLESSQPQDTLLALYAAKMGRVSHLAYAIKKQLQSPHLPIQLAAIEALYACDTEESTRALFTAFSSNYLYARMHAASLLAAQRRIDAFGQIEALMHKSPDQIKPYFCSFFAQAGDPFAIRLLQQALTDKDPLVKSQALIQSALHHRYELSSACLKIATHTHPMDQEAAAFAIGMLQLEEGLEVLERLINSPSEPVQLASSFALYQLGHLDKKELIEKKAQDNNLYAIGLLASISEAQDLLKEKLQSQDLTVRLHATISLLQQGIDPSLERIEEALFLNHRGMGYKQSFSFGSTMRAFKLISNYDSLEKAQPHIAFFNRSFTIQLLQKVYQLPERIFLHVAEKIFSQKITDLISPTAVLLEHLNSPASKELLETYSHTAGSPLIRGSCLLSLYRLTKDPQMRQDLLEFAKKHIQNDPFELDRSPTEDLIEETTYELSAQQKSSLLIETIYTLAQENTEDCFSVLMEALKDTKAQNQYIISGMILSLL